MKKAKLKHAYVSLLDLPEALPFGIMNSKEYSNVKEMDADQLRQQESDKKLFEFVELMRKEMKEEFVFIGDDIIGEKFYKRFLFEKGGFIEIMTGVPVAISAHFTAINRANLFASALKKAIANTVAEKKFSEILENTLVVNEEESYKLTYETWDKVRQIREGT